MTWCASWPGSPSPSTGSGTPSSRRPSTTACSAPSAACCTAGPPGPSRRRRQAGPKTSPLSSAWHFAAAGEAALALRYYEQAGDHATASFANDEAISSFRAALEIAGEGEGAADLQAKLANVLWRTGRRSQAREAFQAGLRAVPAGDTLRRAHLLTRLGRLEVSDNRFEVAWAAYDAAEDLLGGNPEEMDAATVEEWLELMVDGRACQYVTEHQVEEALTTLAAVGPVIGRGSAARKHSYYFHLAMARVTQNRFRVDETDLDYARRSLAAAQEAEEKDVGYATFFLGPVPAAARRRGRGPGPPGALAGPGRTDR